MFRDIVFDGKTFVAVAGEKLANRLQMFAAESSHGRGFTCQRQNVPGQLGASREELAVSEAF